MTWVKICGITNLEDAQTAVAAGADALGFVFYEKSPRNIDLQCAHDIVEQLPSKIEKVGIFVDNSVEQISGIVWQVGLTAIQVYNCKLPGQGLNGFKYPSRKVFVALSAARLFDTDGEFGGFGRRTEAKKIVDAIFLDSGTPDRPGGTGKAFDWVKAAPAASFIAEHFNLVIGGGLTPLNVAEVIRILKPWGVDVSSGVEERPGKKDAKKVQAFIAAVRRIEKSA